MNRRNLELFVFITKDGSIIYRDDEDGEVSISGSLEEKVLINGQVYEIVDIIHIPKDNVVVNIVEWKHKFSSIYGYEFTEDQFELKNEKEY